MMAATRVSAKARQFSESVIREMTRHALAHGAVNLAQGFPDFPCPEQIKEAACRAIRGDVNQYAITWGAKGFREALAAKVARFTGLLADPEREITVTCGSTEAMIAALLAVVDPGDEVIVFEPFYENYGPDTDLCGAVRRVVPLRPPDWTFDPDELRRAFNQVRVLDANRFWEVGIVGLDVKAIRTQPFELATKHLRNSLAVFLRLVELARSLDRKRAAELVAARDYEELDWLILTHLMGK